MNIQQARKILNIPENSEINEETIKKYYRMMALKYHPDKNKESDASSKFLEIHNAYEFLSNNKQETETENYDSLLKIFINQIFDDDFQKQIIYMLLMKILQKTSNQVFDISLQFLENIDIKILKKIYNFFNHYADIFESLYFIEKIKKIIEKKEKSVDSYNDKREYIVLHPLLEDLFENNLYKLNEYNQNIIVPLWHHELIYDISGIELYVECYPILPDNIKIDEENNIHVCLKYTIKELWSLEMIEINLGNRTFLIERQKLFLIEFQQIIMKKEGISKINEENIYDISEKSDIIVHIYIDA
jgi:curved DNA-binding protein CbpA